MDSPFGAGVCSGIDPSQTRPSGFGSEPQLAGHGRPVIVLEPAPIEYGLHRAQYDAVVRELEAAGFSIRLNRRRTAYRNVGTMTFGTFYDLIVRFGTDSGADPAALIERLQHLLSSDELPATPRMGKLLLDDGTEHAFPLDEADVP